MTLREMLTSWPALVMGWPAVTVALFVYVIGLISRRPWLGVAAVLVSTPFCLYVSLYPRVPGLGLVTLACNVFGCIALYRQRMMLATVCWLPFIVLAGFIASWVLEQAPAFG